MQNRFTTAEIKQSQTDLHPKPKLCSKVSVLQNYLTLYLNNSNNKLDDINVKNNNIYFI